MSQVHNLHVSTRFVHPYYIYKYIICCADDLFTIMTYRSTFDMSVESKFRFCYIAEQMSPPLYKLVPVTPLTPVSPGQSTGSPGIPLSPLTPVSPKTPVSPRTPYQLMSPSVVAVTAGKAPSLL